MMTEMYEKIDYKALQQKTLEQFKADNSLVGKNGAFAPLIKQLLETELEAELEEHIANEEEPNRKNGKVHKTHLYGWMRFIIRYAKMAR